MEEILKQLLAKNKVIPFIGAGVSMAVKKKDGSSVFPNWGDLLLSFTNKLNELGQNNDAEIIRLLLKRDKPNYLEIADKIKEYFPNSALYEQHLESIFDVSHGDIDHESLTLAKSIWGLKQNLIITTNYEKILEWSSPSPDDIKYWDIQSISEQASSLRDGVKKPTVWHLHGHIDNKSNMILTTEGFNRLYRDTNNEFNVAINTFKHYLASKSFLFIGYSLDDAYLVNELEGVCEIFDCRSSEHYVLLKKGTVLPTYLNQKVTPIYFEDFGQPLIDKIKSFTDLINVPNVISTPIITTAIKNKVNYLTSLPSKNERFLGRVKELEELKNTLTKEGMVYVINGIGGVGKSELSYEYLHKNRDKYNNIAFLEFSDENTSVEDLFRIKFKDSLALTKDDNLDTMILKLQSLPTKNLLILDNLHNKDDFEKIKPLNTNFDMIITTRRGDLESRYKLNLEVLSDEDARALFISYFYVNEDIDDILNYLDKHALFIYLTAKALDSGYLSIEELRDNIRNGEIGKIEAHDDQSFHIHLEQRFKRQFEEEDNYDLRLLLQQLSIFPSIEIEEEKLKRAIIGTNLKKNLSKLVSHGWLIKKGSSYKLHQIIKTFLWDNYALEYDQAVVIMNAISSYLDPNDIGLVVNYELVFIPILDSILTLYKDKEDNDIAKLLDSLTLLYFSIGDYVKSTEYQEKSEKIRKKHFGEDSVEIAINCTLKGRLFWEMGKEEIALTLYEEALILRQKYLHPEDGLLATSYNNLATCSSLNNREKALELLQKSIDINIKIYGENDIHVGMNYNNIAALKEEDKSTIGEAEFLYRRALEIYEAKLGYDNPETATVYTNFAIFLGKLNRNKSEILGLYEKALLIRSSVQGEWHPDTGTAYFNMAFAYKNDKKCILALSAIEKSVEIYSNLNYTHPRMYSAIKMQKDIQFNIKKEEKYANEKKKKYCKN